MIASFMAGCIFLGFIVVAVHFLRFWRRSGDSFFLLFAIAFGLLGIERICVAFFIGRTTVSDIYIIRLVACCLILAAIAQKNRA